MLPALLPLVLSLAPQLAGLVFGSKGGEATAKVASVVQAVTGADPTNPDGAAAAVAAIQGKPEVALALQQKLAELHQAMQAEADRESDQTRADALAELKTRLEDTAGARAQTVTLAQAKSPLAWGSPALSAIILISFGVMLYLVVTSTGISEKTMPMANVLLGTLAAMATQVANYWLGSSHGSAAKDAVLADAQQALASSVPMSAAGIIPSVKARSG